MGNALLPPGKDTLLELWEFCMTHLITAAEASTREGCGDDGYDHDGSKTLCVIASAKTLRRASERAAAFACQAMGRIRLDTRPWRQVLSHMRGTRRMKCEHELIGHSCGVTAVAAVQEGKLVISGSEDGKLRVHTQ
jgi:hypothetical protein